MSSSASDAVQPDPNSGKRHLRALDRRTLIRSLATIACALVAGLAFVTSYVGGLHAPTFHRVSLAVAGSPTLAHALGSSSDFAVTVVPSTRNALARINDRRAFAAVSADSKGITVFTAPAAGVTLADSVATNLPAVLRAATHGQVPIRVAVVKPLPATDPTGVTAFYLVLALIVSNYVGAILFGIAIGTKPTAGALPWRLLAGVGIAVVLGLIEVGLTVAIGPLRGHFLSLFLVAMLIGFTASTVTLGLQSLFGMVGTTMAILVFVVLGNPASGGAYPFPLLPGIWRWVGPYVPAGAGVTFVRNIVYFDGHGTGFPVLVLFCWLVVGLAVALVSVRVRPMGLQMKRDFDRQHPEIATT